MYEKYNSYKDSGVEWLGMVPEHWEMRKGKWLFNKEERPVRKEDEIVTCFRDGEVTLRKNRRLEGFTNALQEHGYQGVRKGDLVIHAMDAFAGAIGVSDSDGKSTPVYSVCTPRLKNEVNQYFYAYFLRNMAQNDIILSLAKGIRQRSTDFRFKDFGELEIVFPPLSEQTSIASFLDKKTSQIDHAIELKEKTIALLKERKQIVIQELVTGKVVIDNRELKIDNARLIKRDEAEMKDSGVEWIGMVPKSWEVKRLKTFSRTINGATPSSAVPHYWNGEIVWLTPIDINNIMYASNSERKITQQGYNSCGTTLVPRGSIILTTRAPIGKTCIANVELCTNQGCKSIVLTDEKVYNTFVYYVLKSGSTILNSLGTGTTFMELSNNALKSFELPIPPLDEQQTIVHYIETESSKIDNAISLQEQEIEKLKELKATLIDSAVTGKIKIVDNG